MTTVVFEPPTAWIPAWRWNDRLITILRMGTTHPTPESSPYDLLGGDAAVRRIVGRFYDLMDETPEYYIIRKLHPESLDGSREKLYLFLSGWLGGPQLYVEKHGHPQLRARHLPFPIGTPERDAWLACMREALEQCEVAEPLQQFLMQSLSGTADWMRNRKD
jgi:hemoglobin